MGPWFYSWQPLKSQDAQGVLDGGWEDNHLKEETGRGAQCTIYCPGLDF